MLRIGRVFAGAVSLALILEILNVPAAILVGAIVGSALANQEWGRFKKVELPKHTRTVGFIIVGCVSGVMLTVDTLAVLAIVVLPIVVAYLAVGGINIIFVTLLMRKYGVDPITAVLATTPGGVSEISGIALDKGANLSLVLTVHSVRFIVIVLGILPISIGFLEML